MHVYSHSVVFIVDGPIPYLVYQVSFISYLEKNKKYIQQYTMKSIRGRYLPQTTLSMLTEKFRSRLIVYGKNALR